MYDAALSPKKRLLVLPSAEHDTTYSSSPQVYETAVAGFLQEALLMRTAPRRLPETCPADSLRERLTSMPEFSNAGARPKTTPQSNAMPKV
jgi:hypothetical protein